MEISLKANQFCNLTSINASNIKSQKDLNERARVASFIGTLQAGYTNFHYLRDIWKKTTEKESLLGVSMTGIASGDVLEFDMHDAAEIVKQENERIAKLIGINKAARTTAVKPEGTSSLVLGTSSGVHAWHSPYYIRRLRILKNESIYSYLKLKIPELVEDDFVDKNNAVVSIPIKAPDRAVFRDEPALSLLERVKKVSVEWVKNGHRKGDNTHNVSCTVSIRNEKEWEDVGEWMWENRSVYNGLSVLPYDGGSYKQMPFQEITKEQYEKLLNYVQKIDLSEVQEDEDNTTLKESVACGGGVCEVL